MAFSHEGNDVASFVVYSVLDRLGHLGYCCACCNVQNVSALRIIETFPYLSLYCKSPKNESWPNLESPKSKNISGDGSVSYRCRTMPRKSIQIGIATIFSPIFFYIFSFSFVALFFLLLLLLLLLMMI